jgi:hypothetical protein
MMHSTLLWHRIVVLCASKIVGSYSISLQDRDHLGIQLCISLLTMSAMVKSGYKCKDLYTSTTGRYAKPMYQ